MLRKKVNETNSKMDQKHVRMHKTDWVRVATFEFHANVQTGKLNQLFKQQEKSLLADPPLKGTMSEFSVLQSADNLIWQQNYFLKF